MVKVGDKVKVTPKSSWTRKLVADHGEFATVAKLGDQNVMLVDKESDGIDFSRWGYWAAYEEVDLTPLQTGEDSKDGL